MAELNRAGIPTGVLIAPLMPGINDAPEQVEPLLEAAEEAGATSIGGVALHLRGEVRDVFMDWMRDGAPGARAALRGALPPRAPTRRSGNASAWRGWCAAEAARGVLAQRRSQARR